MNKFSLPRARGRIETTIFLTAFSATVAFAQFRETSPRPVFPDSTPVRSWESLSNVALPNTTIDSVVTNTDGSCRVTATVTHPPSGDRVRVWIALPMKGWNRRFEGTGGGGFSGGSPFGLRGPLRQGFAAGATDTGHAGMSGSFGLDAKGQLNWQAIEDNAYLGIHEMTVVGKALTKAYYGKAPRYSYFVGFSTGGRQGLMEAQRYPDDYDGIVSGCPAINWPKMLLASLWPQLVMVSSSNRVSTAKLRAATAAAVAACDANDGVTDGLIEDPSRCTYDPKALVGTRVVALLTQQLMPRSQLMPQNRCDVVDRPFQIAKGTRQIEGDPIHTHRFRRCLHRNAVPAQQAGDFEIARVVHHSHED